MDHFPIILALTRSALKQANPATLNQAKRLMEALRKDGAELEALAIRKLLEGGEREGRMEPSRVVLSRAALPGEVMTPSVRAPVDRETAAPLADIRSPGDLARAVSPVLNTSLQVAVDALSQEWQHLDRLKALGVRPPLNCLFYGAPGTGKTRLAQVISRDVGLPLVTARLDGLISSYLGTTARNISSLFDFANRYQCVLLLDEFDAIAKVRDDPHEVGEIKRVVNTLLQCLDGRSEIGITLAITNHEQLLDTAIWRRFDARIMVPKPEFNARLEIVNRYVEPMELSGPERRFLAWLTEELTGSDIETLVSALKRAAAMSEAEDFSVLDAIKRHALLSANYQQYARWRQVLGSPEQLSIVLKEDAGLSFTQDEVAQFIGKDQSTISRWQRKRKASEAS